MQFSVRVQDARLDAIQSAIGPIPVLKIRTGAAPSNCAAPDSGTVLAIIPLPPDWMLPAADGTKQGSDWKDSVAETSGRAQHFRIYSGSVCHLQGSVGAPGSGADMELKNVRFAVGERITITEFTLKESNG